jgi:hypothetical protein
VQGDCRSGYLCLGDRTSSHMYCAAPPTIDSGLSDSR